jgi:hypothetical protein
VPTELRRRSRSPAGQTSADEDVKTHTKRLTTTLGVYVVLNYLVIALFILLTAQRIPAPIE